MDIWWVSHNTDPYPNLPVSVSLHRADDITTWLFYLLPWDFKGFPLYWSPWQPSIVVASSEHFDVGHDRVFLETLPSTFTPKM